MWSWARPFPPRRATIRYASASARSLPGGPRVDPSSSGCRAGPIVRSWSAGGELVDHPPKPYRIPLDTAAVDPRTFATFLPPSDRASVGALANGLGILGASSASLRGLGPGSVLAFPNGRQIQIAGV